MTRCCLEREAMSKVCTSLGKYDRCQERKVQLIVLRRQRKNDSKRRCYKKAEICYCGHYAAKLPRTQVEVCSWMNPCPLSNERRPAAPYPHIPARHVFTRQRSRIT